MQSHASALIIARPGQFRDSLQALVMAVPQIGIVEQVEDRSSALRLVAEHHPSLVLLDSDLQDDDAWNVLQEMKNEWPDARYVVLIDNTQQEHQATALGVDSALLKGFAPTKLYNTIERLLSL